MPAPVKDDAMLHVGRFLTPHGVPGRTRAVRAAADRGYGRLSFWWPE